jgi:hypothetical protein
MSNAKLIVKDAGDKVVVYTTMPAKVVAPKLYTELSSEQSKAVRSLFTGKFAYLNEQLAAQGAARLGRRNSLKADVRKAMKGQPKAATPGTEVNTVETPSPKKNGRFVKGSPEAKAHMAALRAKRSSKNTAKQQDDSTELVINEKASLNPSKEILEAAREHARATGDWTRVEKLLDAIYS